MSLDVQNPSPNDQVNVYVPEPAGGVYVAFGVLAFGLNDPPIGVTVQVPVYPTGGVLADKATGVLVQMVISEPANAAGDSGRTVTFT